MGDEERRALARIDDTLAQLWEWWRNPSTFREGYAAPIDARAMNVETHRANEDLLAELEAVQEERRRVESQLMQGQLDGLTARIAALGERAERLRTSFLEAKP